MTVTVLHKWKGNLTTRLHHTRVHLKGTTIWEARDSTDILFRTGIRVPWCQIGTFSSVLWISLVPCSWYRDHPLILGKVTLPGSTCSVLFTGKQPVLTDGRGSPHLLCIKMRSLRANLKHPRHTKSSPSNIIRMLWLQQFIFLFQMSPCSNTAFPDTNTEISQTYGICHFGSTTCKPLTLLKKMPSSNSNGIY